MDWTPIIVASVAAVPGALALISQARAQKANSKKADAEAADVQVGTSLDMMQEMREYVAIVKADLENQITAQANRIDEQESEIIELKRENKWLRNGVGVLIQQLRRHNIEPEFTLEK